MASPIRKQYREACSLINLHKTSDYMLSSVEIPANDPSMAHKLVRVDKGISSTFGMPFSLVTATCSQHIRDQAVIAATAPQASGREMRSFLDRPRRVICSCKSSPFPKIIPSSSPTPMAIRGV